MFRPNQIVTFTPTRNSERTAVANNGNLWRVLLGERPVAAFNGELGILIEPVSGNDKPRNVLPTQIKVVA